MTSITALPRVPANQRLTLAGLLTVSAVLIFASTFFWPLNDWWTEYMVAASRFLHGGNPYSVKLFAFPVWSMALLAPLSLIPSVLVSRGIMAVLSMAASMYVCYRYKIGLVGTLLFICSAGFLESFLNSNIEPLVILGLFIAPKWGLPLIMTKPQVGIGYAVYQAWWAWKEKRLITTFAPLVGVSALCIPYLPAMLGSWVPQSHLWSWRLFPWSIPLGVVLLAYAILSKRPEWTLVASVMFSPYVALYSWGGLQISIMAYGGRYRVWMLAAFFVLTRVMQVMR